MHTAEFIEWQTEQLRKKQAEIDELQAMYEKQGLYAFELQKQIDEAIEVFEAHDLGHIDQIEKVYGILKGNQDGVTP